MAKDPKVVQELRELLDATTPEEMRKQYGEQLCVIIENSRAVVREWLDDQRQSEMTPCVESAVVYLRGG